MDNGFHIPMVKDKRNRVCLSGPNKYSEIKRRKLDHDCGSDRLSVASPPSFGISKRSVLVNQVTVRICIIASPDERSLMSLHG